MECKVCGFSGTERDEECGYTQVPWIELEGVERGPFFAGLKFETSGKIETSGKTLSSGSVYTVRRGTPTRLLACPKCGTVKIEV